MVERKKFSSFLFFCFGEPNKIEFEKKIIPIMPFYIYQFHVIM